MYVDKQARATRSLSEGFRRANYLSQGHLPQSEGARESNQRPLSPPDDLL